MVKRLRQALEVIFAHRALNKYENFVKKQNLNIFKSKNIQASDYSSRAYFNSIVPRRIFFNKSFTRYVIFLYSLYMSKMGKLYMFPMFWNVARIEIFLQI